MRILAIRLARFGDIVLLLPSLNLLKKQFPNSHLSLLTDVRWAPLAEMCPAIDEVLSMDRLGMRDGSTWAALKEIVGVARRIRNRRFDLVIDFHGLGETNALTLVSGAPQRLGLRRFDQSYWGFCFNLPPVDEDKEIHVSDMFERVARRFAPHAAKEGPAITVPADAQHWAGQNLPEGPLAALYIDAPVADRMWPPQNFAVVANHLIQRFGAGVLVLCGPGRAPQAEILLTHVEARDRVRVFSALSIPQLAAAISSAQLLISNDTGPMHLGPAFGVPTIGIFSVGIPKHFRPTGEGDCVVQGKPIEKIRHEMIIESVDRIWASVRSDLRR